MKKEHMLEEFKGFYGFILKALNELGFKAGDMPKMKVGCEETSSGRHELLVTIVIPEDRWEELDVDDETGEAYVYSGLTFPDVETAQKAGKLFMTYVEAVQRLVAERAQETKAQAPTKNGPTNMTQFIKNRTYH